MKMQTERDSWLVSATRGLFAVIVSHLITFVIFFELGVANISGHLLIIGFSYLMFLVLILPSACKFSGQGRQGLTKTLVLFAVSGGGFPGLLGFIVFESPSNSSPVFSEFVLAGSIWVGYGLLTGIIFVGFGMPKYLASRYDQLD